MAQNITIAPDDVLTVKASAATPAAAAASATSPATLLNGGEIPADVLSRGTAALKAVSGRLNDTLQNRLAAQAAATVQDASLPPGAPLYLWNVATYGPINLSGANPPFIPNKVLQKGSWALMIGISYADPATNNTQMYLAAKDFRARFTTVNLTRVIPGNFAVQTSPLFDNTNPNEYTEPAFTPLAPLGEFSVNPFHYFAWFFRADLPAGSEGELYEVNFDIDISFPGVPGAGFATSHFDPDSTSAIPGNIGLPGLPGTGPGWRNGTETRFMINNFPG